MLADFAYGLLGVDLMPSALKLRPQSIRNSATWGGEIVAGCISYIVILNSKAYRWCNAIYIVQRFIPPRNFCYISSKYEFADMDSFLATAAQNVANSRPQRPIRGQKLLKATEAMSFSATVIINVALTIA